MLSHINDHMTKTFHISLNNITNNVHTHISIFTPDSVNSTIKILVSAPLQEPTWKNSPNYKEIIKTL